MSREAMQLALHTLEGWANYGKWVWPESALEQAKRNTTESIAALRQALETEQKPVGWLDAEMSQAYTVDELADASGTGFLPLYTAPPKQWVGLTTDEMKEIADRYHLKPPNIPVAFRAIEAKLKERNG